MSSLLRTSAAVVLTSLALVLSGLFQPSIALAQVRGIERGGGFDRPFVPVRVRAIIRVKKAEKRTVRPKPPVDGEMEISSSALQRYEAGRKAYDQSSYAAAIVEFEAAVKLEPGFTDALIDLGDAYFDSNNTEAAAASYRRAIATAPNNTDALFRLGRVSFALNDIDGAISAFQQVVAARPKDPVANYNLGLALKSQRRYDEATPAFETAIANGPEAFPEAWINLSRCLLEAKKTDEAETAARKAIEMIGPDAAESATAWYALASILSAKTKLPEAAEALAKAIAVCAECGGDQVSRYYFALGSINEGRGLRKDAADAYEKFLQLAPETPSAVADDIRARIARLRADREPPN